MRVTVKLFGPLREAVGAGELPVELAEGSSLGALRERLAAEHPAIAELDRRLRVAVNLEIASDDPALHEGDEVALLPPVSGGSGRCRLLSTPLEVDAVAQRVAGPDAGGVVTFVGAVRDRSRGKRIEHLEYEAYPELAIREMERIAEEAAQRWPGTRVAIDHRSGAEAFLACRYAIDELKQRVPIWKKEVATDGASWVDEHA